MRFCSPSEAKRYCSTSSKRRFFAFPSSVPFEVTGHSGPTPDALSRFASTPCFDTSLGELHVGGEVAHVVGVPHDVELERAVFLEELPDLVQSGLRLELHHRFARVEVDAVDGGLAGRRDIVCQGVRVRRHILGHGFLFNDLEGIPITAVVGCDVSPGDRAALFDFYVKVRRGLAHHLSAYLLESVDEVADDLNLARGLCVFLYEVVDVILFPLHGDLLDFFVSEGDAVKLFLDIFNDIKARHPADQGVVFGPIDVLLGERQGREAEHGDNAEYEFACDLYSKNLLRVGWDSAAGM